MNNIQHQILTLLKEAAWPAKTDGKLAVHRSILEEHIEQLINADFAGLVQLLYRLDVDEKRFKQALKDRVGENPAYVIADLIIERQQQKLDTRKEFPGNNNIADTDKW